VTKKTLNSILIQYDTFTFNICPVTQPIDIPFSKITFWPFGTQVCPHFWGLGSKPLIGGNIRAILWSSTELADFGCFLLDAMFSLPHPPVSTPNRLIGIFHFNVQSKLSRNLMRLRLIQTPSSLSTQPFILLGSTNE